MPTSQVKSRKLKVAANRCRPSTCALRLATGRTAFTLIEVLITIVLVGIVLLALIMGFHESLNSMERQRDMQKAAVLSKDLMNEIRSKDFIDPQTPARSNWYFGYEESQVRRLFDDVDDYHRWSETPPQTLEGNDMANFAGFTRRVIVVNVPTNDFNAAPEADNGTYFKRITVVVSNARTCVSNVSVVSLYD